MKRQIVGAAGAFSLILAGIVPAFAKPPSDVSDLVGARGAGGETQMESRGYELARSGSGAQFWWNSNTKTCARIVVSNGRYSSVDKTDASDCGHGGSGGSAAGAAIAGIAAVGLIAALASHKKHHGSDQLDADHDSEYSRGYSDGLYGGQYDRNDSEAYHDGFTAGQAESSNRRAGNSRYVRNSSDAARAACEARGDQYLNVPGGSSVAVSQSRSGGNYVFTVASGHYRARCTATASGNVLDISPY